MTYFKFLTKLALEWWVVYILESKIWKGGETAENIQKA